MTLMAADPGFIARRVRELGPWFHNLDLGGVRTAPDHFLGDYPAVKWRQFADALPRDLGGRTVLDIGCNAGFYSFEAKRRGASRVLGIDHDPRYLDQARLAAEVLGFGDIEWRAGEVWDVGALGERFDLVIFMGVLYHLRHPLLALDLIREHVADGDLLFQSLQAGSTKMMRPAPDYEFFDGVKAVGEEGWPAMYFIEERFSGDPTNWWLPNASGSAAMLRAAGFDVLEQPTDDVFWCRVSAERPTYAQPIYASKGPAA